MPYQLAENLSCCDVAGRIIFLDVARDRYFMLTGKLENAMRRFNAHEDVPSALLSDLAATRILTETQDTEARASTAKIRPPVRSAIEQSGTASDYRLSLATVFEVMRIVWWTRRQLKSRGLKATLDGASAYRDRKTRGRETPSPMALEHSLLQANAQFALARRYVPVAPTCLLDSLSLLRFFSQRWLSANLVFGVTPEPFAAHCWVQVGDMVLNETLSDAHAHTPIRMV